ncbi:hypothetical protein NITHO_60006 [Nitrolancea hollandica Lb]|uniref:Uncharacterized protein n=1 Tax=Nitrolancea hollandica Lb TaxID=1129897 RepID=I4EMF9_9BACT|nr:hypothetical protein NITHO_60006 [Nitrolancea hollandica Lb]
MDRSRGLAPWRDRLASLAVARANRSSCDRDLSLECRNHVARLSSPRREIAPRLSGREEDIRQEVLGGTLNQAESGRFPPIDLAKSSDSC